MSVSMVSAYDADPHFAFRFRPDGMRLRFNPEVIGVSELTNRDPQQIAAVQHDLASRLGPVQGADPRITLVFDQAGICCGFLVTLTVDDSTPALMIDAEAALKRLYDEALRHNMFSTYISDSTADAIADMIQVATRTQRTTAQT